MQLCAVAVAVSTLRQPLVFRLPPIGVLLSTATAPRGLRVSTTAVSPTAPRTPRSTCVQCGLFNYLSIYLFIYLVFWFFGFWFLVLLMCWHCLRRCKHILSASRLFMANGKGVRYMEVSTNPTNEMPLCDGGSQVSST